MRLSEFKIGDYRIPEKDRMCVGRWGIAGIALPPKEVVVGKLEYFSHTVRVFLSSN